MKLSEFKPTEEVLERVRKCTTAEEVEKLAREYDVELTTEEIADILKSSNLRELNGEQLDQVAGGNGGEYSFLPADCGAAIGKYEAEAYIGREVYLAYSSSTEKQYVSGTLVKSWEDERGWFRTVRTHKIIVKCTSGPLPFSLANNGMQTIREYNKEYDLIGDGLQLFLKNKS